MRTSINKRDDAVEEHHNICFVFVNMRIFVFLLTVALIGKFISLQFSYTMILIICL